MLPAGLLPGNPHPGEEPTVAAETSTAGSLWDPGVFSLRIWFIAE